MYGAPYMSLDVVNVSGSHASVTVRGFSPAELRRRAALDCRVRLYEGRFEATGSPVVSGAR